EDAGLRPGIMDGRRYDMGLLEIENGRTKRQQADPYRDTEQIGANKSAQMPRRRRYHRCAARRDAKVAAHFRYAQAGERTTPLVRERRLPRSADWSDRAVRKADSDRR